MFEAPEHPCLVPFDGTFAVESARTRWPDGKRGKKELKKELRKTVKAIADKQRKLFARDRRSILCIFQAMDAAGKDGTIRAVFSGVDPAGCQVSSFKRPSAEELDHDYLWRCNLRLPERGRIGIFNRSYYEEVLVVRVHPGVLDSQRLPRAPDGDLLWGERFESIRDLEKHLARNGTAILKFWLNVSRDTQRERFLARLDDPDKSWKFNPADVQERDHWDAYMNAYEQALAATSRPWAPWYAIPADDKPTMRLIVAQILDAALEGLGLRYPDPDPDSAATFDQMRRLLG